MLKSMTGYGRCEEIVCGKKIQCEIKSVNHRYSDYSIRLSRNYGFLEDKVRQLASESVARGKVDIYVGVESYETTDSSVRLNEALAGEYITALKELRDKFSLADDISVMSVARYPDIFKLERMPEDEDEVWNTVRPVVEKALFSFNEMRMREGERLAANMSERIANLLTMVEQVEKLSEQTVRDYSDRLHAKIKEVLQDRELDEARVLTEVAIFADKVAVDEEMVRLRSHFKEFEQILASNIPSGRKLDFLVQEINREVNTTGSKASDVTVTKLVVEMKGEIEKLREQIQNIE